MKRNLEKGSALVVVTACLVIALLFALGWIFWQNFVHKDETKTTADTSVVDKQTTVPKTTEKCLTHEKLCFDYPENWSVAASEVQPSADYPKSDKALIKNASGATVLTVETGATGLGGACDPDTKDMLMVKEAQKVNAAAGVVDASTKSTDIYAIKAVYHDVAKGYASYMFLSSSINKSGDITTCLPTLFGLYGARNVANSSVAFTNQPLDEDQHFVASEHDATSALDSSDSVAAFKVLRTAHY